MTSLAESIVDLHNWTMSSVWLILGLVFFLFGAALHRFWLLSKFPDEESDVFFRQGYGVTRRFSHSPFLESGWTAVPPLVILAMLLPTFGFLYVSEDNSAAEFSAKAVGHQWYWSYELDGFAGGSSMDSYGLPDQDLRLGQIRLLEVDQRLHLKSPGLNQILVTSQDVVHSWALPAAGAKMDAIPGRLNQLFFSLEVPGVYFGQCSELCGISHSQMPIGVLAESAAWDLPPFFPGLWRGRPSSILEWIFPVAYSAIPLPFAPASRHGCPPKAPANRGVTRP
jgi:heme/copper-type cytochrome/quinol oxidase subunit 2